MSVVSKVLQISPNWERIANPNFLLLRIKNTLQINSNTCRLSNI
jgi:hypothetical protein